MITGKVVIKIILGTVTKEKVIDVAAWQHVGDIQMMVGMGKEKVMLTDGSVLRIVMVLDEMDDEEE